MTVAHINDPSIHINHGSKNHLRTNICVQVSLFELAINIACKQTQLLLQSCMTSCITDYWKNEPCFLIENEAKSKSQTRVLQALLYFIRDSPSNSAILVQVTYHQTVPSIKFNMLKALCNR